MKRADVLEAAAILGCLDGVKSLRANIANGDTELRLYALTGKETMEDEIGVTNTELAKNLLTDIIVHFETRLEKLKVEK